MKFPHLDFQKVLPPFLLAMAIANFILACHVGRQNYPTEIHHYEVITNLVPSSVQSPLVGSVSTGSVSSVFGDMFSPRGSKDSVITNAPASICQTSYQYFVVGRRIGCKMFGRFYFEGSPCSYGRIQSIFPDRIILASGNWIDNKQSWINGNLEEGREYRNNDRRAIR